MLISLGSGAFMWKRDLSRFFLQLPLCPTEYNKVCFIWRGSLFFFTSFVWGCRHAGMSGQRVSSAVSAIHRSLGTNTDQLSSVISSDFPPEVQLQPFNTFNYSDDFGGCEQSEERALLSFNAMGELLKLLGLTESEEKAVPPSQVMTYLGLEFDSKTMELRVNSEKCNELRNDLQIWMRKTRASKSDLQSILGKLIWVSKAVKFSRVFVLRIINEIKLLKSQKDKITLSDDLRKDFLWWKVYMDVFNGV